MVVVEVISPDETHQGLLRKLREYDTFQVPHIWVVEPQLRSFHVYQKGTLREVSAFEIPELNFQIDAVRLFAEATSR